MTEKFKLACIEYEAARLEIKRLSDAIGDALADCHIAQQATYLRENPEKSLHDAIDAVKVNHLEAAYALNPAEDWLYSDRLVHANGAPEEYLSEICPHCLSAHKLIQDRKDARKRFGIAKRRISALGRAA